MDEIICMFVYTVLEHYMDLLAKTVIQWYVNAGLSHK